MPHLMSLSSWWDWLENTPLAMSIGESWWFPFLESVHVIGVTLVFGSILMMDLRLIGVAARGYRVTRMSQELVPWTWAAFVLSAITGTGLFITHASSYVENPAMQIKLFLLALAGINMLLFHFGIFRYVAKWDSSAVVPSNAKAAGILSLLLWTGVILAGRWVGHLT